MTPQEKKIELDNKRFFLQNLIIEFMHFVKSLKEDDEDCVVKTNAKFKDLDTQWRRVCQAKECRYMKLRNDAFAVHLQKILDNQKATALPEPKSKLKLVN